MTSSKQFFCSITIFGEPAAKQSILRSGANNGDYIAVTGSLGGSIQGKHFSFKPRVEEGAWLAQQGGVTAMLDVSDGLCQDLNHLLRASNCGARLDLESIPVSRQARHVSAALSDGEDFELLMTIAPRKFFSLTKSWRRRFPKLPLTVIGKIVSGKPMMHFYQNGEAVKKFKPVLGFKHF